MSNDTHGFPGIQSLDANQDAAKLQREMQVEAEALSNAVQFARNAAYSKMSTMMEANITPSWVDIAPVYNNALEIGKAMEQQIQEEFKALAAGYEERLETLNRRARMGIGNKGPIVTTTH